MDGAGAISQIARWWSQKKGEIPKMIADVETGRCDRIQRRES